MIPKIELMNRRFLYKAAASLLVFIIFIFQGIKRNEIIEEQELFEKQLRSARTPYSKILSQRCVYRDSIYKVYIANIEDTIKLIFLATDSLSFVQKESKFFVHLYPKDKSMLKNGKNHLNFDFENEPKEFQVGGRKYFYSARHLPQIEVDKLHLGQYGFRGNNSINWRITKLLLAEYVAKILKDNNEEMPIFRFSPNNF